MGITCPECETRAPSPNRALGAIDPSTFCVFSEEATGIGLQLLFCEESQEAMRGHTGCGCCCVNRAAESDWAASSSFPPLVMPLAGRVGRSWSPHPLHRGGIGTCLRRGPNLAALLPLPALPEHHLYLVLHSRWFTHSSGLRYQQL